MLSSSGSLMRWCSAPMTSAPSAPISSPPPAARTKSRATPPALTVDPTAAATATRNSTSALASLIRLSPSRMVMIRRGRPIRRPMAVAEMASVGATTAPKARQMASGTPGSRACTTNPTAAVVKITRPTASSRIGRMLTRNAGTEVSSAAT